MSLRMMTTYRLRVGLPNRSNQESGVDLHSYNNIKNIAIHCACASISVWTSGWMRVSGRPRCHAAHPFRLAMPRTRTPALVAVPATPSQHTAPLSPCGRDPVAGMRTSTPHPQIPRCTMRPDYWPPPSPIRGHPAHLAPSFGARAVPP